MDKTYVVNGKAFKHRYIGEIKLADEKLAFTGDVNVLFSKLLEPVQEGENIEPGDFDSLTYQELGEMFLEIYDNHEELKKNFVTGMKRNLRNLEKPN